MTHLKKELDSKAIEELVPQIKGAVILPNNPAYEASRAVYNAMIDKYPAIIIKCADVADVILSVNFGRQQQLPVAVRGGGHNGGGLGVCDDGLVIDLSGLNFVRVNTIDDTVRVGGGTLLNELDHATYPFGLAVPAGIISTTGISGLTLGGGIGYLTRKYGLTIDNLLEADMVLADGSFVTANENRNSELFWAIRGGGGNFGIVTSFKYQGRPIKDIYGGPTLWPVEKTVEILKWFQDFLSAAPEELSGFFATMTIPGPPFPESLHHKKFCGIIWCYSGDLSKAEDLLKPALALNPVFAHLGAMPYPAIQRLFDGLLPPGLQWYWRSDFFDDLGKEASEKLLEYSLKIPTPLSQIHFYPVDGAAGRIAKNDTPWAYRKARFSGVIVGVDPNPANATKITKWCKETWEALHPFSLGGAYSNFMMDENPDRVKASYKYNYPRLVKIKTKYDPDNFFRINQNIVPEESF